MNIEQIGIGELRDRISIFQCNQNDSKMLTKIGNDYGGFDLIIDDGCHFKRETENTFNTMWKFIRKNGWYAIEDWGMGFKYEGTDAKEFRAYIGMVDLVLSIANRRTKLGIGEFRILLEHGYSVALFRKST